MKATISAIPKVDIKSLKLSSEAYIGICAAAECGSQQIIIFASDKRALNRVLKARFSYINFDPSGFVKVALMARK